MILLVNVHFLVMAWLEIGMRNHLFLSRIPSHSEDNETFS